MVINEITAAPTLLPCEHCGANAKIEQAQSNLCWIAIFIHDASCFWAKWLSGRRQIILERAFAAWNTRAAAPEQQWQPISSVPRGDNDILLVWPDGHQQIDRLTSGEASFWFDDAPTHWQPLPPLPNQQSTPQSMTVESEKE